jgi:hypothetical protein
MKVLLKCTLLLTLIATFGGCQRSKEFDPKTGITTQMDFQIEIIKSDSMKANATWTNTKEFDVKAELKKRYDIDLTTVDLLTFKVNSVTAIINETRCKQLSNVGVTMSLPATPVLTAGPINLSGSALQTACGLASFIKINSSDDLFGITTKEYAPGISSGGKVVITYSMTAKEDFATATGIIFTLSTTAQFKPKSK